MALDFTGFDAIPEHTRGALERYVEHRIQPGSFLRAVLIGDLYGVVERADSANLRALTDVTRFVAQRLPCNLYGSAETVENYLDGRG